MNADYYRLLFDYGWWARDRLFMAAEALNDEQWRAPNGFTYGSIAGILRHTLSGDRVWGMRFMGMQATAAPPEAELPSRAELLSEWQAEEAKLRPWLLALKDADLEGTIPTRSGEMMLWKAMSHITYHAMQHRSEAAEALTIAGSSPGNLDLMIYLAETGR